MEIEDASGHKGYGEGTPRSYVTGEQPESTRRVLLELGKKISVLKLDGEERFLDLVENLSGNGLCSKNPSAACAIELALLDLFARKLGIPIWKLFRQDPATEAIHYSSILPVLSNGHRDMILRLTKKFRIRQIKTKATDIENTVNQVSRILEVLGHDADLRIDANAAFSADSAIELVSALNASGLSISCLEQPVSKKDLDGLRRVEKEAKVPVIADESFCSEDDLEKIISNRYCSGINVRLSKCGGLIKSMKLVNRASEHGLFCQLGCHVGETSVLSAAGQHLAALCGPFRFVEGCYSQFLLKEDVSDPPLGFGLFGKSPIPTGPGLGIDIKESALEKSCIPICEF